MPWQAITRGKPKVLGVNQQYPGLLDISIPLSPRPDREWQALFEHPPGVGISISMHPPRIDGGTVRITPSENEVKAYVLPWSWEQYERWLTAEWASLLDRSPSEPEIQGFLEGHPCLVPGGEGGERSIGGHHGSFPAALFSQPELPGLTSPCPDFLWISKVSSLVRPVLIEIERPRKLWFRSNGVMTYPLNEAIDQRGTWRTWFENGAQQQLFYERYGIDDYVREYHKIDPAYCLIYGRRREFEEDGHLTRKREELRPNWLEWMTFVRLRPLYGARNCVSARFLRRAFRVIAIPPTFAIGPETMEGLGPLLGLEDAIRKNELISDERREFLINRLPYWQAWAARAGFPRERDR